MKIKTKPRNLLLAMLIFLTMCIFTACGTVASGKKAELKDFVDSTETVEVGTTYEVQNPAVFDTEGNEYQASYVVKDSAEKTVPVIGGCIEILNINGYVVEYSVEASGKLHTRKLTLTVTDSVAPIINAAVPSAGYVGEEYLLPKITVSDNAENSFFVEKKLYFINGEEKTEIEIKDDKFTPTVKGRYCFYVKAVDAAGNPAEKNVEFSISTKMEEYVLADFSDNADMVTTDVVYASNGAEKGWVNEFQGAEGVAWMTGGDQQWKNFALRFGTTETEMKNYQTKGWDYFSVRLYIDKAGSYRILNWNVDYVDADGVGTDKAPISGKQWVTVYMARSVIDDPSAQTYWQNTDYTGGERGMKAFNSAPLRENGITLFWISGQLDADTKIYVDEMRLVKAPGFSVSGISENVYEGDTVNFTVENPHGAEYDLMVAYNDLEIEISQNSFMAENPGVYTITLMNKSIGYIGNYVKTLEVLPLYAVEAESVSDCAKGDTVTLPAAVVTNLKTGDDVPDAEISIKVWFGDREIPVEDGTIIPKDSGIYQIVYSYKGKYTVETRFKVFFDYFYTSFETADEFKAAGTTNVEMNNEKSVSYANSAKFTITAADPAKFVFVNPIKQNIKSIGVMIYSEVTADISFVYETGAYTCGGGTSTRRQVAAGRRKIGFSVKNGWNSFEFDVVSVQDILLGGLTCFGFESTQNIILYADDLAFYSADLSFENDTDQGTAWEGKIYGTKSTEQAHSGQYSAKLVLVPNEGGCMYHFAFPLQAYGKKIGLWIYNGSTNDFGTYFSVSVISAENYDINEYVLIKKGGWNYYEFAFKDVEKVSQNGICQIMFWSNDANVATIYVDDISFIDADITFEGASDALGAWEGRLYATVSTEYNLNGNASAKVPCETNQQALVIWHQNPHKTAATKIGMWIYSAAESVVTMAFSMRTGQYTSESGAAVDYATVLDVAVADHISVGWNYYEFEVDSRYAENMRLGGVIEMGFWSNHPDVSALYLDNIVFINA